MKKITKLWAAFLLVAMFSVGSVSAQDELVLFDIDFTKWTGPASINETGSTSTEVTYNGITFRTKSSKGYSFDETGMTWCGNNISTDYNIKIPLAGINGSITIRAWNGTTDTRISYFDIGTTTKQSTSTASPTTVTLTTDLTETTLTLGRQGSTLTKCTRIQIVTPAPTVTAVITPASNNEDWGSVSLSGTKITAEPAQGYGYADPAYTVTPTGAATVSQDGDVFALSNVTEDCTVTINFIELPTYTASFVAASGDVVADITEEFGGAGIILPSSTACVGGIWDFIGWTDAAIAETTDKPTLYEAGDVFLLTENTTLYAVYSNTVAGDVPVVYNSWDFTGTWSIDANTVDDNLNQVSDVRISYAICPITDAELVYSTGAPILETAGLLFTTTGASSGTCDRVRLDHGSARLGINGSNQKITIPCESGNVVIIEAASANATDSRGFTATGGAFDSEASTEGISTSSPNAIVGPATWVYKATDSKLVLATSNGMNIYKITVSDADTSVTTYSSACAGTGINDAEADSSVKEVSSIQYFNILGESIASDSEGIVIVKTIFVDGDSSVSKVYNKK